MRKKLLAVVLIMSIISVLTGCKSYYGELDEGDCKLTVKLTALPSNMNKLGDSVSGTLDIVLTLTSATTDKRYPIHLDSTNGYVGKASLKPGTYKVDEPSNRSYEFFDVKAKANETMVKITKEKETVIEVSISDMAALESQIEKLVPTKEILEAKLSSHKIQMEGKIFPVEDILKQDLKVFKSDLKVTGYAGAVIKMDSNLKTGERASIQGGGISVTVYNDKETELKVKDCKVLSISLGKNVAILPGGVRLGLSAKEITDPEKGILGKPDKASGNFMLGWELDKTKIIYIDEERGDRLAIDIGDGRGGNYKAQNIEYELEGN